MFSNRLSRRRAISLQRKATNNQASGKRKDKRSPHIGVLASSVAAGAMMLATPHAAHAEFLTIPPLTPASPECVVGGTAVTCTCLLYTSPSPRDKRQSRMPSSA